MRLTDGYDDTEYTEYFPCPVNLAAAEALTDSDRNDVYVGNVGMTAEAVLAPGRRPFTVGKPAKNIDINHFPFSSGHLNERLLRGMAWQHGITLTGVLQSR